MKFIMAVLMILCILLPVKSFAGSSDETPSDYYEFSGVILDDSQSYKIDYDICSIGLHFIKIRKEFVNISDKTKDMKCSDGSHHKLTLFYIKKMSPIEEASNTKFTTLKSEESLKPDKSAGSSMPDKSAGSSMPDKSAGSSMPNGIFGGDECSGSTGCGIYCRGGIFNPLMYEALINIFKTAKNRGISEQEACNAAKTSGALSYLIGTIATGDPIVGMATSFVVTGCGLCAKDSAY